MVLIDLMSGDLYCRLGENADPNKQVDSVDTTTIIRATTAATADVALNFRRRCCIIIVIIL
jgi:hypothetical protein